MKNDEKSYIILEIKHHFDNFDEKIMKQTWTIESSKSKPTLSHGSKLSHQLTQQVWLVFIMLFSPKNLIKSSGRLLAKHLFLPPHDMFFPIQFFTSYFFCDLSSSWGGSKPIVLNLIRMNIHKSQQFWCELQQYMVLIWFYPEPYGGFQSHRGTPFIIHFH